VNSRKSVKVFFTILDPKSFFVTALVITLCIISTFCKELGIMTIPLIICVDILKYKLSLRLNLSKLKKYRVWIKRAIIYLFAVGGLVTFRLWLVNFEPPKFQIGDNPFSFIESNFWRFVYTYSKKLICQNSKILFYF